MVVLPGTLSRSLVELNVPNLGKYRTVFPAKCFFWISDILFYFKTMATVRILGSKMRLNFGLFAPGKHRRGIDEEFE